jgi:hypothetical protein
VKTALVVARLSTIKTWRASTSPSSRRADLPLEQRRRTAVRAVALGRANWIFAGSNAGLQRAAAV